jgi:hypothetical protein
MDKVPDDTNQGTPSKGDSCAFPFFEKCWCPFDGHFVHSWVECGTTGLVGYHSKCPNTLDASQLRTLCHGHHVDVPSSTKSSPPPSAFSGESIATSNQKSKRNRKRKNRKKKSPTSVSHVGDRSSTSASHVEDHHPASASHVGGKQPTSASHVGDRSSTSASHVEDQHPTSASHVGGMNLVPASHTGVQQPTSASHVGELSTSMQVMLGESTQPL